MARIERGSIAVDIAAREAQVIGDGPRIEPLGPDEVDGDALDLIVTIRNSVGVTSMVQVPEYFGTMLKHPAIFRCQMEMGTALFKGLIPVRERELAVLRVGWLTRSPYEWGQHVEIARRYGVPDEDILRARNGSSDPGWSVHDRAVIAAVEELLGDYAIADDTWAVLAQSWSEAQLIEFPMMVGQYVATAFVQNSLRVRMAAENRGLSHC